MSFMDNLTRVVNGQVEFDIDDGQDQNLVNYCNKLCTERCESPFDIEDPKDCDCEVAILYLAVVKLAEWECRGMTFEEYCKITKPEKSEVLDSKGTMMLSVE